MNTLLPSTSVLADPTTTTMIASTIPAITPEEAITSSTKSFVSSANDDADDDDNDCCLLLSNKCDDNDDDLDDGVGQATETAVDTRGGGQLSGSFVCGEADCNYRGKSKKALNR